MKQYLIAAALSAACLATQAKDIVDTAVSAGNFKTLAAALQAAGLVDTLKGPGPFTRVRAHRRSLCQGAEGRPRRLAEGQAKLSAVLTYHVVPGKVMAKGREAGMAKTVQGSELSLTTAGGVQVNGARVTSADIVADNGVIHVIDTVLMPK